VPAFDASIASENALHRTDYATHGWHCVCVIAHTMSHNSAQLLDFQQSGPKKQRRLQSASHSKRLISQTAFGGAANL
jgi:hypothetical protein